MIMKKLILITWCVIELTSKNLLTLGFPTESILSSPPPKDFDLKWATIKNETAIPDTATTSKNQNEAKKVFKNEYGYSISEVYDSQTQKNGVEQSSTVPDTQLLYHSLKNPLLKSNSLNIEPHGDVHKISSPLKSSWIFSPPNGRLVEKRGSAILTPSNFSLKFSDNITLSSPIKLNTTLAALDNSSSFLSNIMPSFDKLETFEDIVTTTTTVNPLTQKSFFGYNIKEVTSNGKTRGTVQVFGNGGIEKNVQYNESTKPSNITNLLLNDTKFFSNNTKSSTPITTKKQSSASTNVTNTKKSTPERTTMRPVKTSGTTAPKLSEPTTAAQPAEGPRHIIIQDAQPFAREFANDQPIASDFATPEFILYDFIGQLQNFPYIPAEDFDDNRYSTFDELVSQNTYVYEKR